MTQSSVMWDVPADGVYELVVQVDCSTTAVVSPIEGIDQSFSKALVVTVDRKAPKEFSQHMRPTSVYFPGDDISVAFNEAIDCSLPRLISATLSVAGGPTFSGSDLLVLCSENAVFIDLGANALTQVSICMSAERIITFDLVSPCSSMTMWAR